MEGPRIPPRVQRAQTPLCCPSEEEMMGVSIPRRLRTSRPHSPPGRTCIPCCWARSGSWALEEALLRNWQGLNRAVTGKGGGAIMDRADNPPPPGLRERFPVTEWVSKKAQSPHADSTGEIAD